MTVADLIVAAYVLEDDLYLPTLLKRAIQRDGTVKWKVELRGHEPRP